MGCGRKIARFGAVLALALSGAVKAAEPAEPLTVTKLGDTETKLLISSASDNIFGNSHAVSMPVPDKASRNSEYRLTSAIAAKRARTALACSARRIGLR